MNSNHASLLLWYAFVKFGVSKKSKTRMILCLYGMHLSNSHTPSQISLKSFGLIDLLCYLFYLVYHSLLIP